MANRLFSQTPGFNHPRRNAFDLSFLNLLTSNFGDLKVCLCKETVPGDLWQCQSTALVRVAPMLAPVMANMDVYIHYFYVPNRIIWTHWNDFITGGLDGTLDPSTDSDVVPPYFSIDSDFVSFLEDDGFGDLSEVSNRSLWDSLNLPSIGNIDDQIETTKVSSLPFRAYQLIYQEYYEDELLKRPFFDPDTGEDVPIDFSVSGNELVNGGVSQALRLLYQEKRSWGKDYFTTARPNVALTGDTLIPISGNFTDLSISGYGSVSGEARINGDAGVTFNHADSVDYPFLRDYQFNPVSNFAGVDPETPIPGYSGSYGILGYGPDLHSNSFNAFNLSGMEADQNGTFLFDNAAPAGFGPLVFDPGNTLKASTNGLGIDISQLEVDGSDFSVSGSGTVEGGTIRDLKLAIQTYEYDAKGQYGNRPTEWHYNHFGVIVPDATIQRPIYLGGGKTPIMVSEVLQNSGSNYTASGGSATPQGNMAGHGIGVAKSNKFRHYCEEYGFIIGIMSIIPKTAYYQGIPKMFDRWDRLDYYTPEFANIGEVPVKNQELYFDAYDSSVNEGTFGYQSPYADLKFSNNEVHGDFRDSLEFWHTGRKFAETPQLNWEFIHCDHADQLSRIFAVESENYDHFYIQCWHNLKATRLMPKFGTFKL